MNHSIEQDKLLKKALERQAVKCEEQTIKEVLRKLLDREPTIDDAKRCSQVLSDPWNGSYLLKYNDIEIGIVRYVETDNSFRVEFQPIQKAN